MILAQRDSSQVIDGDPDRHNWPGGLEPCEWPQPLKHKRYDAWWIDRDMTLCIGALCNDLVPTVPSIVCCFDSKVSNTAFGSETEYKFHVLSDNVMAMVADRPGRAKELAGYYRAHLANIELNETNLLSELQEPIRMLKRRIGAGYIGRKCMGVSYEEFLSNGVAWFGQPAFDRHSATIESNPLGVDMIIAGFFRPQNQGHYQSFLCKLRDGEINRITNFALIGSGTYTAEPALHSRSQNPTLDLPDTVYNVYEAKKLGESSPSVGQKTTLYVLQPPDPVMKDKKLRVRVLREEGEKELAKRFKKYGPRPVPAQKIPDGMFMHGSY